MLKEWNEQSILETLIQLEVVGIFRKIKSKVPKCKDFSEDVYVQLKKDINEGLSELDDTVYKYASMMIEADLYIDIIASLDSMACEAKASWVLGEDVLFEEMERPDFKKIGDIFFKNGFLNEDFNCGYEFKLNYEDLNDEEELIVVEIRDKYIVECVEKLNLDDYRMLVIKFLLHHIAARYNATKTLGIRLVDDMVKLYLYKDYALEDYNWGHASEEEKVMEDAYNLIMSNILRQSIVEGVDLWS